MLIQVKYPDNRFDFVKENILDHLIESQQIAKFKRSTGWVTLGLDQIRASKRDKTYKYPNELRRTVW